MSQRAGRAVLVVGFFALTVACTEEIPAKDHWDKIAENTAKADAGQSDSGQSDAGTGDAATGDAHATAGDGAAAKCADAKECDDGNTCTKDTCEPAVGCVNDPVSGPCDDGNKCTIGNKCDKGLCKTTSTKKCPDPELCFSNSCDPKTGKCVVAPLKKGTACDDGIKCTQLARCDGAGKCGNGEFICGCVPNWMLWDDPKTQKKKTDNYALWTSFDKVSDVVCG